jgi:hypothetical protein
MPIFRTSNVILLCSLVAEADTVTTRDSRSWNGHLVQIQSGILTLSAGFPGSQKSLQFGPRTLRAIEFNPTTYNPGVPPNPPRASGGSLSGTVYLRDKTGHRCENLTIDPQNVKCSVGSWPRQSVARILFDP